MNDGVINVFEDVVVPDSPKVLPNEQALLYAPIATKDNYGMVQLGDSSDEEYYFESTNGILNVDIEKVRNKLAKKLDEIAKDVNDDAEAAAESAEAAKRESESLQESYKSFSDAINKSVSTKLTAQDGTTNPPMLSGVPWDKGAMMVYAVDGGSDDQIMIRSMVTPSESPSGDQTLVQRDEYGRSKVNDPEDERDIVNKRTMECYVKDRVDAFLANLLPPAEEVLYG